MYIPTVHLQELLDNPTAAYVIRGTIIHDNRHPVDGPSSSGIKDFATLGP